MFRPTKRALEIFIILIFAFTAVHAVMSVKTIQGAYVIRESVIGFPFAFYQQTCTDSICTATPNFFMLVPDVLIFLTLALIIDAILRGRFHRHEKPYTEQHFVKKEKTKIKEMPREKDEYNKKEPVKEEKPKEQKKEPVKEEPSKEPAHTEEPQDEEPLFDKDEIEDDADS